MTEYILAVDAGTTSIRCILYDRASDVLAVSQKPITQHYPQPGWVEHDPVEIWNLCRAVILECLSAPGVDPEGCVGCSITDQRETSIVWDRATGEPVHNAIVWQDHRTAGFCDSVKDEWKDRVAETTGLKVDSYFSATKIKWILDNVDGTRDRAERGELAFGTIDTWLLWNLTGGKAHATDVSNASRTMLFDIRELKWDDGMLRLLDIPKSLLPEVHPSGYMYGRLDASVFGIDAPICGIVGDQQASLFGQSCLDRGDIKITFGTGGFLLMNLGDDHRKMDLNGLLHTVAWGKDGRTDYAIEGSFYIAGAVVQWLRDTMKVIKSSSEIEALASSVDDNAGCYLVPAFVGLGAPYWDPDARGTIVGLTRGTTMGHIARAALESIAYQSNDVMEDMESSTGARIGTIKVDGGACANNLLCQLLADISGARVVRPRNIEATAFGSAAMAGLTVGFWKDEKELASIWELDRAFEPGISEDERMKLISGWKHAVACSRLK